MARCLIVANRTACDEHVLDALRRRREEGVDAFHLLVPASHPAGSWTDGQARAQAGRRLREALDHLAGAGIDATGEVGDASPVTAVTDVLRREAFDEILVSTLPAHFSRWLGQDVPARIRRATGLPVHHVLAEPAVV